MLGDIAGRKTQGQDVSAVAAPRAVGFSLELAHGLGGLVLSHRRFGDWIDVERLALELKALPARFDMTRGVDRFRHHRTCLRELVVGVDDFELEAVILSRGPFDDAGIDHLELRAWRGHLVVAGALSGTPTVPFFVRLRPEIAAVGEVEPVLVSAFDTCLLGPTVRSAPEVAASVLDALGLGPHRVGPTIALLDPLGGVLAELFSEIGWKLPDRGDIRITEVEVDAGRLRVAAAAAGVEARCHVPPVAPGSEPYERMFLADYEAKTMFASIEAIVGAGRIDEALAAYLRQLELHPDHPFLISRLLQLGVTRPGRGDAVRALARRRLERAPEDVDASLAMAALHRRRGDDAAAARIYSAHADRHRAREDVLAAAQCLWAAALSRAEVDPRGAIEALEQALALRRTLPGALRTLASLYARIDDATGALRVRERLVETSAPPEARVGLLVEMGQIALTRSRDSVSATRYFERALSLAPDDARALIGLAAAHEVSGRLLPATRALDRAAAVQVSHGAPLDAARTLARLAALWRRLPNGDPAAAALRYRRALELDPECESAHRGLADLSVAAGDVVRARQHLEALLRGPPPVAADEAMARAAIHLELAELLSDHLDDPAMAVSHYQKALTGEPAQQRRALAALARLYEAAGRYSDLARVLEAAAHRAQNGEERAIRLRALADAVWTRLGDRRRAEELLVEAARHHADDPEIWESLVAIRREGDDPETLVATLARLTALVDAPARLAGLYCERAELLIRRLNRVDAATEAYGLALGCDPDHAEALDGLIEIQRERERWGELAPLLERRAKTLARSTPNTAAQLWSERARLLAGPLGRPGAAVESFEAALQTAPDDVEGLRGLADLHFEAGRFTAAVPRYEHLYDVYERDGYDEPRGPFLVRLVEAVAASGHEEAAFERAREGLLDEPDCVPLYERAASLRLRAGDINGIVALFRAGVDRTRRDETRCYLAVRAGRLAWREQRRADVAAPLLELAARLDPDDDDIRALRIEVARAEEDWETVDAVLAARLSTADVSVRPALLTERASLAFVERGRPDEGMGWATEALTLHPEHVPTWVLLAEQAWLAAEWPAARAAYAEIIGLQPSDSDALYRLGVAALYSGDPGAAAQNLDALWRRGDARADLLPSLAEAYLQAGDSRGLATVYADRLAVFAPEASGRAGFVRRAARIFAASAEHHASATAAWVALLALVPDDIEATEALRAVSISAEAISSTPPSALDVDGRPASASIAPSGEERDDESAGLDARSLEIDGIPVAPVSRLDVDDTPTDTLDTAPPLAGSDLGGPTAELRADVSAPADQTWREVSGARVAGPDPTLSDEDLNARAGRIEAAARAAGEGAEAARRWCELAELHRDMRLDLPAATLAFQQAVAIDAADAATWSAADEALEELLSLDQNWDAVVALCDARLARGVGSTADTYLLKASMLRSTGRYDEAADAARAARPQGGERALDLLVTVLQEAGRTGAAAAALLDDVDTLGPDEAARRRWRAADLVATTDPATSVSLYAQAARVLDDDDLAEGWVAAARRAGGSAPADALEYAAGRLRETGPEAIRAVRIRLEAADAASAAGRNDQARRILEVVLAHRPDHAEALARLEDVLAAMREYAALSGVLERQLEAMLPGPMRVALALRHARLRRDALSDEEGGRIVLIGVFDEAGDDPVALEARAFLEGTDGVESVDFTGRIEGSEADRLGVEGMFAELHAELTPTDPTDPAGPTASPLAPGARAPDLRGAALLPWTPPPDDAFDGDSLAGPTPPTEPVLYSSSSREPAEGSPLHRRALEVLERVYRQERRGFELCDVLQRHINLLEPGEERAALWLEKAQVYDDWLSAPDAAWRAWRAALRESGATSQTRRAAFDALRRRAIGPPDEAGLDALLDEMTAEAVDAHEVAFARTLRGEMLYEAGEIDAARLEFDAALEADPTVARAVLALARIAAASGDATAAADAAERALVAVSSRGDTLAESEIARAFEILGAGRELGDAAAMVSVARTVLDTRGDCEPALDVLESAADDAAAQSDLALRYGMAGDAADAPAVQCVYFTRQAELLAELGRAAEARAAISRAVERAPHDRLARATAMRLAEEADDWSDFALHGEAMLSPADEGNASHADSCPSVDPSPSAHPAERGAAGVALSLARVYADRLDAPAEALRHLRTLVSPDAPALAERDVLERLVDAARRAGANEDLVVGLSALTELDAAEAGASPTTPVVVERTAELIRLLVDELGRVDEARERLEAALAAFEASAQPPASALLALRAHPDLNGDDD